MNSVRRPIVLCADMVRSVAVYAKVLPESKQYEGLIYRNFPRIAQLLNMGAKYYLEKMQYITYSLFHLEICSNILNICISHK